MFVHHVLTPGATMFTAVRGRKIVLGREGLMELPANYRLWAWSMVNALSFEGEPFLFVLKFCHRAWMNFC